MEIDNDKIKGFLEQLIREDGGYADTAGSPDSAVRSINSVIQTFGKLGLPNPEKGKNAAFVDRCLDGASGGFSQTPGSEADPFATASALIVLHRLEDADRFARYQARAVQFMNERSSTQYDHFMTIAAYDECGIQGSTPDNAVAYFDAKGDVGSYGQGIQEIAISVASLLRAGRQVKDPESIVATLLAGQCADGGFGGDADTSDLFTTYCVMRALVLLGAGPRVRKLNGYLTSLQKDKGFAATLKDPTSAGATYMALSVLDWIGDLQKLAVDMARAGDVEGLRTWLENGGDPNLYDSEGWTPLLGAAARGKPEVVDLLLHHGCDTPQADPDLRFLAADALPIYMAGQAGDLETIKLLLKAKPEHLHEISRVNGHTVLLQAAFYGRSQHLTLAEYLLDNCCEILGLPLDELELQQKKLSTVTNVRGYTALTMQDLWHNDAMSRLLGRYPQPTDEEKAAYLDGLLLRIAGPQALTERLIDRLTEWQRRAAGIADADYSADGKLIEQAIAAVDRIISLPNFEIDRLGSPLYQTPLIYAITGIDSSRSGADMRYTLVKHLLDQGADPKVIEKHPMAIGAVIRASVLNQFGLLKLIAEYMTPEDFAKEMNTSPAVNGLTALHDAVHRAMTSPLEDLQGHLDQISWMLTRGARDDIPDHTGQTQRQLAIDALGDDAFPQENVNAVRKTLGIETSSSSETRRQAQMTHEEARAAIQPFYNLFSAKRRDWEKGLAVLADDWKAYYSNTEYRGKAQTREFLQGFFDQIPDIEVTIHHLSVDGEYISVRSELTGTPISDSVFWGAATGKSFRIMTIDFNRICCGKLIELYHSEDWLTAREQLKV
jgi:prenyltransferase beta subunit/predicted ester cyclase